MRRHAALGLFLLIPILSGLQETGSPPQDEPATQEPTDDEIPPWDFGASKRNAELMEGLRGAWMLQNIQGPSGTPRSARGFMLIGDGFLSMEIHGLLSAVGESAPVFQSGVHLFELTPVSYLQTTGLIGVNNMTDPNVTEFERPGLIREFRVELNDPFLTLRRRGDNTALKFKRIQHPNSTKRDLFGREIDSLLESENGGEPEGGSEPEEGERDAGGGK